MSDFNWPEAPVEAGQIRNSGSATVAALPIGAQVVGT